MGNKNISISIIRVLAMLSIVMGHIFTYLQIYTYQLFSVAVNLFLFLSGYLYSNKEIKDKKNFLINRVHRILIPFWLVCLFIYLYLIIFDNFSDFYQILINIFNLQGIDRILVISKLNINLCPKALQHCWFLTVIFFSYIIMLCLKTTKIEKYIESKPIIFLIIFILLQIALAFCGIHIVLILCFFLGYFYGKHISYYKSLSKQGFIILSLTTFFVCLLRLISRKYIDGTILHNSVIAGWSFNFLAMWLFISIDFICKKWNLLADNISKSFIWRALEKLSYPIYLVHFMFLKQPLDVSNYIHSSKSILVFTFSILTILSATILYYVFVGIEKTLSYHVSKNK